MNWQGGSTLLPRALHNRKRFAVEGKRLEAEVKVREVWTVRTCDLPLLAVGWGGTGLGCRKPPEAAHSLQLGAIRRGQDVRPR